MITIAPSASAATALVLCRDPPTRSVIVESLRSLAIRPETCEHAVAAIRLLERQKFEAVIVDLLLGEEAVLLMKQLQFSRTNRTAVTFTISPAKEVESPTEKPGSTFVLRRPLSRDAMNRTLRAGYGLLVRERRRYFRCPVEVPAIIAVRSEVEVGCQTINVSEGGVAIQSPGGLGLASLVAIRFSLPERRNQIFAETTVCWQSEGRAVGLMFQSLAAQEKAELQEWLARKLDETLPESVASLFRSI